MSGPEQNRANIHCVSNIFKDSIITLIRNRQQISIVVNFPGKTMRSREVKMSTINTSLAEEIKNSR